jgi:hypothetical protein
MKTDYKIGDRVRAVKDCHVGFFKKGDVGIVEYIDISKYIMVNFGRLFPASPDEIELIESEQCVSTLIGQTAKMYENASYKPFPTYEEFMDWYFKQSRYSNKILYNYFAQFGIPPSRLEQLKSKHPNLTQDEQTELIDLLLNKE